MEEAREGSRTRKKQQERPRIYSLLDFVTEWLIYAVLVFTPWCFGTTERWAIKTVNTWNYGLGGLLLAKWLVALATGYRPARWSDVTSGRKWGERLITWGLAVFTVFILGFTALSAWNARAEFVRGEGFTYFETFRDWLPHSYAQSDTWAAFRTYLGAACFFWALRSWLGAKTEEEEKADESGFVGPDIRTGERATRGGVFPARLKRLLWVLCINGAALAVEGTLQRLSGTNKLLWSVKPRFNDTAQAQFGPFNYRTNGAQYLNMIWPMALAFWWSLHQQSKKKFGEGAEFLLLPLAGLMIAGPIVATSRAGIVIAVAQALAVGAIFAWGFRKNVWKAGAAILILAGMVGAGAFLQWDFIRARFGEDIERMSGRDVIYENSKRIANDFPIWGTGPGTFAASYFLYRADPRQPWATHTHDDYLETLVTMGRAGLTATLLAAALVGLHWFLGRGAPSSGLFLAFTLTASAGVMIHARFDFPFQVYSLLLLYLTLCAILMTVARRS